jgi:hypothetical protein
MFSRTLAFGVALSTLAAATSATAQVRQASPQQASPRQATIPPTNSAGTAGTIRLQGQPRNDINGTTGTSPNGSSTGVQSGSAESVSRTPLLAPEPRLEIRVR